MYTFLDIWRNIFVYTRQIIHHDETLRLNLGYNLSPAAVELVRRLICNAEDRLGNPGTDEIKGHPFFHEVDWSSDLRQRQAPYVPLIRSQEDTSNFDDFPEYSSAFPSEITSPSSFTTQSNQANNPSPAMDDKSHHFFEFTFRRFFDTQTFDNVAVLRTPICENEDNSVPVNEQSIPVDNYSSCYSLQQPVEKTDFRKTPPLLRPGYSPENAMAYQYIREPPSYSAAVNLDANSRSNGGLEQTSSASISSVPSRSAQRDDNAAVYV